MQLKIKEISKYYSDYLLENIDCRQGLKKLEDNSISLVLTDPPYFIDGMGDDWNTGKLKKRMKKSGVVSLPAGMKFDRNQGNHLYHFLKPIADEWIRVLRPGGFCLVFSQNRLVHRAGCALEDAGFEIRDVMLWRYEGQAKAFKQEHFIRNMNISQKEKDRLIEKIGGRKTPQLKPQGEMIILAQSPREGTFVENYDKWETGLIDVENPVITPIDFPGNVIVSKKPKDRIHLTEKPIKLLRHLIRIFSKEESTVLDCFAGSGTTCIAALIENRHFIGYEIELDMHAKAIHRINNVSMWV